MVPGLRIRLSIMMFLEFFVWGAWATTLNQYMDRLGFSGIQSGHIFALLPLACIFMPLIAGQITDRILPTQVFLGCAHIVGALGLLLTARYAEYDTMWWGMLIWSLAYAPTLSLVNSISFSHLRDAERDFGPIRVWGTIGWIIAGVSLTTWRYVSPIGLNDCLYLSVA